MHKLVLHVKIQDTKGNICGAFEKKTHTGGAFENTYANANTVER